MELRKMESGEFVERCLTYLGDHMSGSMGIEGSVDLYNHKKLVKIDNPQFFYEMVEYFQPDRISSTGGYHFELKVPNAPNPGDVWEIVLDLEQSQAFRELNNETRVKS